MPDSGLDARSIDLRRTIVRTLAAGGRGHPGAAFSLVEILRVLYDDVMRFDVSDPEWAARDRLILSKGHGCLALYAMLADKGFISESSLDGFCKEDGLLGGHPERKVPGVEASTGSLGHGLSIGVGMAVAARLSASDYRVFVVLGDGESNEGSVWEAALSAAKHRLSNLVVLTDYNKNQSYGKTSEVLDLEPLDAKWEAFGFHVAQVDGHNVEDLRGVLRRVPANHEKPTAVICHTVKGKGVLFAEGNMEWHHRRGLSVEEIRSMNQALEAARA